MTRDRKDRSTNWIIEHHGGSLLHLANIKNIVSWHAAATVLSFPKQIPDGLLDVVFTDNPAPVPFFIEVESFPNQDTLAQIREDAAMILLTRKVLPDILLIVLSPKGNLSIPSETTLRSAHGLTEWRLKVHVVNLWTVPAEELFAKDDVGLIPWVPLTHYAGPTAELLRRCRESIEQRATETEKPTLLATTRVMAEARYNDIDLLNLLGGQPMTMQKIFDASPTIQRIKAEAAAEGMREGIREGMREGIREGMREAAISLIRRRLAKRFGTLPQGLSASLRAIESEDRLEDLTDLACDCPDLQSFQTALIAPA